MKNKTKIIIASAVLLVVAIIIVAAVLQSKGWFSKGNANKYSVAQTQSVEDSPLKDKTIIFLGSSVTYGSAARGESFVEYLEAIDGIVPVKEAVSGTTLVDKDDKSYVSRLKAIDKGIDADIFVCQLSTNDAKKRKPMGELSDSFDMDSFDTETIIGAMEYIIAYVQAVWDCPVVFYTGTKYNSSYYGEMVDALHQLEAKWGIGVIDLWNSEQMNTVSKKDYHLYMANGIHPTRAGYKLWWTPQFEEYLYSVI